jgi:hypothetical protein
MGTRAAGEALLAVREQEPESEAGALALAAARSLQAQGIRLDIPEEPATPIAEQDLGLRVRQIFETLPDGVGTRQLTLRMQDRYGVWYSLAGVWNDLAGLKEGLFSPSSRREWEQMQQLYQSGAVRFVEISPGYARHQLARAFALNEETGLQLPEEATRLRAWLDEGEPQAPRDPITLLDPIPDEARRGMARLIGDVLEQAGLQSWAFEPADIVDLHDEWRDAVGGHEHHAHDASGACVHEVPTELLARAAEKGIDAGLRAVLGERMKEVAIKFDLLGNRHEAVVAAAAAWQVEQEDATGEIPFFRILADRALNMLDEILEEGKDPEELRYDPMAPPPDAD